MKLHDVLQAIQEPDTFDDVAPQWDLSMRSYPAPRPAFLDPQEIARNWRACSLGDEPPAFVLETAEMIARSRPLCLLAWHLFWRSCHAPVLGPTGKWPRMEQALGDRSGCFFLLISLGMVPLVRENHRVRGFPEEVTRETLLQVGCFKENYRRGTGRTGLYPQQWVWLKHYTREPYVRIGRLEYWMGHFGGGVVACRHRRTGKVQALAETDTVFDRDGFVENADGPTGREGEWVARLTRTPDAISGNPILPEGRAAPETVTLSLEEWECILERGSPVLDMHIPAGGGMTPECCRDSLQRARELFVPRYPLAPPVAVVCRSWIFSPCLPECLPRDSNLVRFQEELYLYPIRTWGTGSLWFIFLRDTFDLATVPVETSLQRAVRDYLVPGRPWRDGGMFIMLDDLARYGGGTYRGDAGRA